LIQVKGGQSVSEQTVTMSQDPQRNLDSQSPGRSRTNHWWLLGLMLALLLLTAGAGEMASHGYADIAPREVLTAASSQSDGRCAPDHQSGHHHGNCGLTTSSSACAFVEIDSGLPPERRTTIAVEADLLLRSAEIAPPLHPPKTRFAA
jgi:hypothetical protein